MLSAGALQAGLDKSRKKSHRKKKERKKMKKIIAQLANTKHEEKNKIRQEEIEKRKQYLTTKWE